MKIILTENSTYGSKARCELRINYENNGLQLILNDNFLLIIENGKIIMDRLSNISGYLTTDDHFAIEKAIWDLPTYGEIFREYKNLIYKLKNPRNKRSQNEMSNL